MAASSRSFASMEFHFGMVNDFVSVKVEMRIGSLKLWMREVVMSCGIEGVVSISLRYVGS